METAGVGEGGQGEVDDAEENVDDEGDDVEEMVEDEAENPTDLFKEYLVNWALECGTTLVVLTALLSILRLSTSNLAKRFKDPPYYQLRLPPALSTL
jgi:hypothetical protein